MLDTKTVEVYNKRAKEYSQMGEGKTNKHLVDYVGLLKKGDRVLDLGCGHGISSSFMSFASQVPPHPGPWVVIFRRSHLSNFNQLFLEDGFSFFILVNIELTTVQLHRY